VKAYNAPEDEFSLALAMIEARAHAGLTQEPENSWPTACTRHGSDCASRTRPGEALNPRSNTSPHAAADFLRASACELTRMMLIISDKARNDDSF
jgi:hypothetical protein